MGAKTIRKGNLIELAYEALSLIQRNNRSLKQIEKLIKDLCEFVDEPPEKATDIIPASEQMTEQQKLEGNLFLLIGRALELALGNTPGRNIEQIMKLIKTLQDFKEAPSINKKPMRFPIPIKPHGKIDPEGTRISLMPK